MLAEASKKEKQKRTETRQRQKKNEKGNKRCERTETF